MKISFLAFRKQKPILLSLIGLYGVIGCLDQFDPRPFWQQLRKEQAFSKQNLSLVDGQIPVKEDTVEEEDENPVHVAYQSSCAPCHGSKGKANHEAALGMHPRPRNFSDPTWEKGEDYDHILKVLKLGGGAVGLSTSMIGWQGILSDEILEGMAHYVIEMRAN